MNSVFDARPMGTLLALFLGTGLLLAVPAEASDEPLVLSHQVQAVFDVPANQVALVDRLNLPAGLDHLRLGTKLEIESIAGPGGSASLASVLTDDQDEDGPFQRLDLAAVGLGGTAGEIIITYGGTFFESVENTVFSRENVGNEITATISELPA